MKYTTPAFFVRLPLCVALVVSFSWTWPVANGDTVAQVDEELANNSTSGYHRQQHRWNSAEINVNDNNNSIEDTQIISSSTSRQLWHDFLKSRDPRRARTNIPVDYMGQHPFERRIRQNYMSPPLTLGTERNADVDEELYQPIRVQFDTHLLDALVSSYPDHVSYVKNVLLPSLRTFWKEILSIIPAKEIEIPFGGQCAKDVKKLSGYDMNEFLEFDGGGAREPGNAIINIGNNVQLGSNGNSLVYEGKDLVVVVIPVEGTPLCPVTQTPDSAGSDSTQLQTLAFATNCQNDQLDRPTVGYTGICFGPMDPKDRTSKTHQRRLLTVAHEFTHILGMNSYDFPYFYNHATGKPRTSRNSWNRPPTSQVLCVDGTRQYVEKASEDTLKATTNANGYIAYEVVTDTVKNVVRNQFDCQELEGARLENQPTGDSDCFGSHWDHRLFNNDFMAAVYTGSSQYVTALTLALLEDSGWYLPNYSTAQTSPFGLGVGCDFVDERCIQNGRVPNWGAGTFCDGVSRIGCAADRHLVAYCDISEWDGNLPSGYQYFMEATTGGGLQQMDFCPSFTTIFRFEVDDGALILDCTDPTLNGAWVQRRDEVFGESSRCIDHASGPRPLCLETVCGMEGEKAGKVIFILKGKQFVCKYGGEIVRLPGGADVICPRFETVCPQFVCEANCAGRGLCDYSQSPPQCKCYDPSDTSPYCTESPYSFAPTVSPVPTSSMNPSASPTMSSKPTEEPTRQPSSSAFCLGCFCCVLCLLALSIVCVAVNNF